MAEKTAENDKHQHGVTGQTGDHPAVMEPLHAPAPETVDVEKNRAKQDELLKEQEALLLEQQEELRKEQAAYDAKEKTGTHAPHEKHSHSEPEQDLEEHTVPELKDIAAQKGITIPWDANKAEIIKAIKKG